MTNQETLQYLSQYPEADVETALEQLGYNINDAEFPESIVEDVENILDSLGKAVAQHKQLRGSTEQAPEEQETPQSESLVIQETTAIAAEILDVRNVQVDQKVLFAIAQSIITQTKTQAAAINRLRRDTLVAELREGQRKLADDLLQVMETGQKSTENLFSDDNLRKMVDQAVPAYQPKFNVDEFINEVKVAANNVVQEGNERARVGAEARNTQVDFDLDSFLNEVWG